MLLAACCRCVHVRRAGLAATYALQLAMGSLKELMDRKQPSDAKAVHVVSSGLKAGATWTRVEVLQACREACGGMGFLAANRIGPMKTDTDVDVTFEVRGAELVGVDRRVFSGWGGGGGEEGRRRGTIRPGTNEGVEYIYGRRTREQPRG